MIYFSMMYLEHKTKIDIREFKQIFLDLHSSPNVLSLNFEDGVSKEFSIVPRKLIRNDNNHIIQDSQNASLMGVDGSGLFALINKNRANLSFHNYKINEIPIRCAFAKSEKGYIMIEFRS